ncbi:protein of unknown function [Candidatus Nitrospira inopinata]|uniref:Uncharacterized protein n=1 Tax=Candidatus Nitrospira inopinata TaxID=1715989 RepID=A0A0S4KQL6_9BACT|nr:protein of unknown function [Candidatus Nitrospira inopinata]
MPLLPPRYVTVKTDVTAVQRADLHITATGDRFPSDIAIPSAVLADDTHCAEWE